MLSSFKNKLNEKTGAAGAKAPNVEGARAGPSKSSKKRGWEGSNIAHTVRAAGQMPTPPPSRTVAPAGLPPIVEFYRPIPTTVAMPVAASGDSSLALLGGDQSFTRAVSFDLPPGLEGLIGSVPEDDILDNGVEMICCGLVLARRGADARRRCLEDLSCLEHDLQEASHNLQQAVDANTTYEEKLCSQAAELELRTARLAEVEKADVDKAAEIALLRKALETVGRWATFFGGGNCC